MGALILRVGEVLNRSAEFAEASGRRWRLAHGPNAPSTVSAGVLAAAAGEETDVVVPRWTSDRRRPPVATC